MGTNSAIDYIRSIISRRQHTQINSTVYCAISRVLLKMVIKRLPTNIYITLNAVDCSKVNSSRSIYKTKLQKLLTALLERVFTTQGQGEGKCQMTFGKIGVFRPESLKSFLLLLFIALPRECYN